MRDSRFILLPLLLAAASATAQDGEIPYVLESMSYVTVGEYAAGGANVVDTSATTDGQENAISHETFAAEVAQAHAEGTGGVIDFEVDLPGNTLRAIDRTLVAGYIRPVIDIPTDPFVARRPLFDNLSVGVADDPYTGILDGLDGADEALWYDPGSDPIEKIVVPETVVGYAFAPEEGSSDIQVNPAPSDPTGFLLVDPLRVIRVEDRRDRQNIGDDPLPIDSGLSPIYATLRGIYGLRNENAISIRRGPMHISEATLATRDVPGRREFMIPNRRWGARGTTNDEFWFRTDFSTGNEVTILRENETFKVAVSGERNLSGGGIGDATAKDLLFDPRDNIIKLGLTLLSHNNFQFWQGLSAEPDNPNNIIVKVWFSDGTSTDYRGTTRQSKAGADTFFGFEAPGGAAITRLQLRVVGRNFRTFTNIDDIGFITGPSAPYISKGAEPSLAVPSAARNRGFVRALEFQRNPDSVAIPGLAALGLSLDAETGLITGTVAGDAPGEVVLDVEMANAEGERTEAVKFVFAEPTLPASPPAVEFTADTQALATLGRDFNYVLRANLDGVEEENVEFFAVARRVEELGANPVISLGDIGLSLSDNVLSGKVVRASAVGTYELLLYAMSPEGASEPYPVQLKVVPPTPEPNFDGLFGNLQTDLVQFDPVAGTLSVLLFSTDPGTGRVIVDEPVEIASGLPADTQVFIGEFNGDANSDLLTFSESEGVVRAFAMSGAQHAVTVLRDWGAGSAGWRVIGVGDLNVDGITDVLIDNPAGGVQYAWILRPLNLGDPPLVPVIGFAALVFTGEHAGNYAFLAAADLNGDGGSDLLWRDLDSGEYVITPFNDSQFTGSFGGIESLKRTDRVVFTMEEGFEFYAADDVNGDGLKDLLWINPSTASLAVWEMAAASVPDGLFAASGSAAGYTYGNAYAGPGRFFLGGAVGEPLRLVDLDNDTRADLVIGDPDGGRLRLVLLDGSRAKGAVVDLMQDGATPRPKQVRLDGTGLRDTVPLASKRLPENFPVPGGLPLALEPDEALFDYRVFEQKTDARGDPLWSYTPDGFHAVPVADTTKPVEGRDVFFNGMLKDGEALARYDIFLRDGDDEQGRPKLLLKNRRPQQKRVVKSSPDPGTRDLVWSPMATALDGTGFIDGVDGVAGFDARGNRGFLQLLDGTGEAVFEEGEPVYELWRNRQGLTVEEQSIKTTIEKAVRLVVGGASGSGAWVAGSELSPIDYRAEPPAGVSAEEHIYGNRRAVTNGIIEALELAGPQYDFPDTGVLPADPGAFDPGTDLIQFDVLLTADENAIAEAVVMVVDLAAEEVVARGDTHLGDPLYDPLDPLEVQLAALEAAVVDGLRLFSRDAAAFSSPEPVFTEDQLDIAVRRAITDGIQYGVEQAGLVPSGLGGGVSFDLEPDDIKLFLSGGESSDILDMKYAMVEALYVTAEKLQGLAIRAAVADAVRSAFGIPVPVADVPLDLVSRSGNVFERLSEADKEAGIENAIIVGIEKATQVTVSGDDLGYAYSESASELQKAQAITDALAAGIALAGGTWAPVPFDYPKDVTTGAGDLINGYRESNSFQQNADAIQAAVAYASNRETGGSLSAADTGYPAFTYFTNAELASRVSRVLALAIDLYGGDPDEDGFGVIPEEPADPGPDLRKGILQTLENAYLKPLDEAGVSPDELDFPQGAGAAAQSLAVREFIARAVKKRFFRSDITAADFPLALSDADSVETREAAVEEAIRQAIAGELPESSFPETAAVLPDSLVLFDATRFVASGDAAFTKQALAESVSEALAAATALATGFTPLAQKEPPNNLLVSGVLADFVAARISESAFGPLDSIIDENGNRFLAVDVGRVQLSGGLTPVAAWEQLRRVIIDAADAAFPGAADPSVLDALGPDPLAGLGFEERGGIILAALADVLASASGRPVTVADLASAAFPDAYMLYELDYDAVGASSFGSILMPGPGFELVGTGDYDNRDSRRDNDLLFFNPATGEYVIYFMRGVDVIGEMRPGEQISLFEAWQVRNFDAPGPGEGLSLYAQGVDDVDDPVGRPAFPEAIRVAGGDHDGAFAVAFDFRTDDPGLGYVLEGCSGLAGASWEPVEWIMVDEHALPGDASVRRVITPDEPVAGVRFYRIRFTVGGP